MMVGLLFVQCALFGATATIKDLPGAQDRLLWLTVPQNPDSAGFDITSTHQPEVEVGSRSDALLDNLALIPGAMVKPLNMSAEADDTLRDGPRSKMRKWFLAILLLGGIVRYLTSQSYSRFVSEVLDPLNW